MKCNAVVTLQCEDPTVKNYLFLKDGQIPLQKTLKISWKRHFGSMLNNSFKNILKTNCDSVRERAKLALSRIL